jgi:hypothetical protein
MAPTTAPTTSPTTAPTTAPTTSPTPSPVIVYLSYDLYLCGTTTPANLRVPYNGNLDNGTIIKASNGICYTIAGPTTVGGASLTVVSEHSTCEECNPTPAPTTAPTTSPTPSPSTAPTTSPTPNPTPAPTTEPTPNPTPSPVTPTCYEFTNDSYSPSVFVAYISCAGFETATTLLPLESVCAQYIISPGGLSQGTTC